MHIMQSHSWQVAANKIPGSSDNVMTQYGKYEGMKS